MPAGRPVVIVGGGIIGLSTAWFLAKDGADVLLAERDEAGMAASTAKPWRTAPTIFPKT